ncbi:MAG: hypothetical protein COB08_012435 [Rhodobacteraceae bacterium]|nr:hypothetical protein [Paracoccaceae bacterium]
MTSKRINSLIRLAIPLALFIIFLFTINGAIYFHLIRSPWNIGDWLINYQGGFVRRGLLGEGMLRLAHMLEVNPGAIVVVLQCSIYAVFLFFAWLLLRIQTTLIPHLPLLLSPFIFLFHVFDRVGGYRKEIILFSIMAYLVWLARRPNKHIFEYIFYGVMLGYPLLILSHEMLAVWLPYLLVIFLYTLRLTAKRMVILLGLVSLSGLAFVMSMSASGNAHISALIDQSLQPFGYSDPYGAVAFLAIDGHKALISTWTTAKDGAYFIYYPQAIVLCLLAFIPVRKSLAKVLATPWAKPLLMVSLIGTILISLVGIDWGRFIYASFVPLFLLTLLVDSRPAATSYSAKTIGLSILALIVYASCWYLPYATNAFPYRWPFS